MDIYFILKIAVIGIIMTIMNQILKSAGREDMSFFVTLAGILVVLFMLFPRIIDLFTTVQKLFTMVN